MDETFSWLGPEPEAYKFYGGEVTLFYEDAEHKYFRFADDRIILIPGVTSACGIVDKSSALMQWSANQATEYIAKAFREYTATPVGAFTMPGVAAIDANLLDGWLEKARFAHKDYKENAGEIGKVAHAWLEDFIQGSIRLNRLVCPEGQGPYPDNEQSRNGCIAALDWMRKHNVRWIHTERKIYSRKYEYAGTTDGLAYISSCGDADCCGHWVKRDGRWAREALHFENVLAVIDWKTSNMLHTSYHWQTAAYMVAVEEEIGVLSNHPELTDPIMYRIVARLGKDDAQFEARLLTPETFNRDFDTFLACLNLYSLVESAEGEERERKKEIRTQKRDDRLTLKCAKADKYQGFRYPKCNGGDPCQACLDKYNARHPQEVEA